MDKSACTQTEGAPEQGPDANQIRIGRVIDGVAFQTRARTVDHLGREQIADCPTAISELWKNAFDAYARNVALDIYDGEVPVAVMSDDGHGMNRAEFVGRWLVVGTESKAADDRTPQRDRNGLPVRPRQGQKGIGRLSCANLGPLLLLMSKRVDQPYVAALVDWRLFENPFLILSDVEIPVVEGDDPRELLAQLPDLARKLAENVEGTGEDARRKRLDSAWKDYDEASWRQFDRETEWGFVPPSAAILRAIGDIPFTDRHLAYWPVFTGEAAHGTALLVSEINFDLSSELEQGVGDTRFLDEGRICLSNNAAERAIRPIAVGRRNWTFAGSDASGRRDAAMYTLIETAKINGVDPRAWLADVLARLPDHPARRISELLPWNWSPPEPQALAA